MKETEKSKAVNELLQIKLDKHGYLTHRTHSDKRGVLFIKPPDLLHVLKKEVKKNQDRYSEEQIKKFSRVFKGGKPRDYVNMVKEFRNINDFVLDRDMQNRFQMLLKKGFPIEGLVIASLGKTKQNRVLKEFFNLLSERAERFSDAPFEVKENAQDFNRLFDYVDKWKEHKASERRYKSLMTSCGAAGLALTHLFNARGPLGLFMKLGFMLYPIVPALFLYTGYTTKKARREPLLHVKKSIMAQEPRKSSISLNDAISVLGGAFQVPRGPSETLSKESRKHIKEVSRLTALSALNQYSSGYDHWQFVHAVNEFWKNVGKITPRKVNRINTFLNDLPDEAHQSILFQRFGKAVTRQVGNFCSSGKTKPGPTEKEHGFVAKITKLPKDFISFVHATDPDAMQDIMQDIFPKEFVSLASEPKKILGFKERMHKDIYLSFESVKSDVVGDTDPRFEKFISRGVQYRVGYPKEYIAELRKTADVMEETYPILFNNMIKKMREAKGMRLTACSSEPPPETMQAIRLAMKGEPFKDMGGREVKWDRDTAEKAVAHLAHTPDGNFSHYDVIQESVIKEFTRPSKKFEKLRELQEKLPLLKEAKVVKTKKKKDL